MTDQENAALEMEEEPTTTTTTTTTTTSALRDNIARKGQNAYYFAHAHKANGPEWDGKEEPKLLSITALLSMNNNNNGGGGDDTAAARASTTTSHSTFDLKKSNITSYAFSDEGATVKLYITMEGVGDKCTEDDISLDHTPTSFFFQLRNYHKLEGEEKIRMVAAAEKEAEE